MKTCLLAILALEPAAAYRPDDPLRQPIQPQLIATFPSQFYFPASPAIIAQLPPQNAPWPIIFPGPQMMPTQQQWPQMMSPQMGQIIPFGQQQPFNQPSQQLMNSGAGVASGSPPNFDPKQICASLSCNGMTPLPSTQTLSGVGTGAVRCDACAIDTSSEHTVFDVGSRCNPQAGWSGMSHLNMLAVTTINVKGPERQKLATGQSVQFPGAGDKWQIFEKIGNSLGKKESDRFNLGSCKKSALALGSQDIVSLYYIGVIEYVPLEEEKRSTFKLRKKIQKVKQYDLRVTLSTPNYAHTTEWYKPKEGNRVFIQTTADISIATPQKTTGLTLRVECASTSHACPAQGWRGWLGVYCEKVSIDELKAIAVEGQHEIATAQQKIGEAKNFMSTLRSQWTPMSPMAFPKVSASEVRIKSSSKHKKGDRRKETGDARKEIGDKQARSRQKEESDDGVRAWVEKAMGEDVKRRRRDQANQNIFGEGK